MNRVDFACVGSLPEEAIDRPLRQVLLRPGPADAAAKPTLVTCREFSTKTRRCRPTATSARPRPGRGCGNGLQRRGRRRAIRHWCWQPRSASGLLDQPDAGAAWLPAEAPKKASSVPPLPATANIIYASFHADWRMEVHGQGPDVEANVPGTAQENVGHGRGGKPGRSAGGLRHRSGRLERGVLPLHRWR